MKRLLAIFALVLAADSRAQPSPGGTVTGTVRAMEGRTQVKRDEIWVYLVPSGQRVRTRAQPPDQYIHQKHEEFLPHVRVVPVGTTVYFPNDDNVEHNVFSPTSPVFDLGRYNHNKKGKGRRFDDPGEHEIYCDIHRQMWARIEVVEADAIIEQVKPDGTFVVHGVPPGKYKLHVWSYASDPVVELEPIVVTDGATTTAPDQNLQIGQRAASHLRKDGSAYPPYP